MGRSCDFSRVVLGCILLALGAAAVQAGGRVTGVSRTVSGTYTVMLPGGATQVVPVQEAQMIRLAVAGGPALAGPMMAALVTERPQDGARAQALLAVGAYEAMGRPDAGQWSGAALFGVLQALGPALVETDLAAALVRVVEDITGNAGSTPAAPAAVTPGGAAQSAAGNGTARVPLSGPVGGIAPADDDRHWLLMPEPAAGEAQAPVRPAAGPIQ